MRVYVRVGADIHKRVCVLSVRVCVCARSLAHTRVHVQVDEKEENKEQDRRAQVQIICSTFSKEISTLISFHIH